MLHEERPGPELSQEGQEDLERFVDTDSWGIDSEGPKDDLCHGTPRTTAGPGHRDHRVDLPIISSFFKGQQSLQCFHKYFDVHELEDMFQEFL